MKPMTKNDQRTDGTTATFKAKGDRHTRRVVFGLTGLLGAVWAVVIATRFSGLMPG